jgi:hypothetical protein
MRDVWHKLRGRTWFWLVVVGVVLVVAGVVTPLGSRLQFVVVGAGLGALVFAAIRPLYRERHDGWQAPTDGQALSLSWQQQASGRIGLVGPVAMIDMAAITPIGRIDDDESSMVFSDVGGDDRLATRPIEARCVKFRIDQRTALATVWVGVRGDPGSFRQVWCPTCPGRDFAFSALPTLNAGETQLESVRCARCDTDWDAPEFLAIAARYG